MVENLQDKIKVLFQTDKEAVVFKPSGIATQLSDDIKGSSLESILRNKLGKENIYFPHRLDRVTSGLILISFDTETVNHYNNEIKNKRFGKYYIARVEPAISDPESLTGIHRRYIKVDKNISRIVKSGGLPSFLEILAAVPAPGRQGQYHVLIKLGTGRRHQIRVMLSDIGLPLSGDHLYNPNSKVKDFFLESIILSFQDEKKIKRIFFYADNPDRDELSGETSELLRFTAGSCTEFIV